jgi:hypothetical protein
MIRWVFRTRGWLGGGSGVLAGADGGGAKGHQNRGWRGGVSAFSDTAGGTDLRTFDTAIRDEFADISPVVDGNLGVL